MPSPRPLILVLFLGLPVLPALAAHTEARLLLDTEAARPDQTAIAGLELKMDSGWHTFQALPLYFMLCG